MLPRTVTHEFCFFYTIYVITYVHYDIPGLGTDTEALLSNIQAKCYTDQVAAS